MLVSESGRVISSKELQKPNASSPMLVSESGKAISSKELHL